MDAGMTLRAEGSLPFLALLINVSGNLIENDVMH
jgi:hypothetical protein